MENFYLDEHVRYILFIYPVVILWLSGMLSNSDISDNQVFIFAGTALHHVPVPAPIVKDVFSSFSLRLGHLFCLVCASGRPGDVEALQTSTLHGLQHVPGRNSPDATQDTFIMFFFFFFLCVEDKASQMT